MKNSSGFLMWCGCSLLVTSCRWGFDVLHGHADGLGGASSPMGGASGGAPAQGGSENLGGLGGGDCDTPSIWFMDSDGDGFGNPEISRQMCGPATGYVENDSDCADAPMSDPACNDLPGGECAPNLSGQDRCDGADNDCDAMIDEDCAVSLPVTSGLILWLDGSDPTSLSPGSAVTQWNDKSGQEHHMRQPVVQRRPTWLANALGGRGVIRFDGSDDYLEATNDGAFDSEIITILVVSANRTDPLIDGNACIFAIRGNHGGETRLSIHFNDTQQSLGTFNGIGLDGTDQYLAADTGYFFYIKRKNGEFAHFIDGVLIKSATQALGGEFLMPIRVGAAEDDFEHLRGDIAEVIVFDRELLPAERSLFNEYIESKWGIDTSH